MQKAEALPRVEGRRGHRLPTTTQRAGGRQGSKCPALLPSQSKFLPERSHLPPRALPPTLLASSGAAIQEPTDIHTPFPEVARTGGRERERLNSARAPHRLSPAPSKFPWPRSIQRMPKAQPGAVHCAGRSRTWTGQDRKGPAPGWGLRGHPVGSRFPPPGALSLSAPHLRPRRLPRATATQFSPGPLVPSLLGVRQESQSERSGTCPHWTPRDLAISEPRTVPSTLFQDPSARAAGCVGPKQQTDLGTFNGPKGSGSRQTSALLPGQPLKGTHPPFPLRLGPKGGVVTDACSLQTCWGPPPNRSCWLSCGVQAVSSRGRR